MSSSSSSHSSLFQSSKIGSSYISNRLAQVVWNVIIELEPFFWNRTGRRNDNSARGHETA